MLLNQTANMVVCAGKLCIISLGKLIQFCRKKLNCLAKKVTRGNDCDDLCHEFIVAFVKQSIILVE